MAVQSEQFAMYVQKLNSEQLGSGTSLPISLAVSIQSLIAALALSYATSGVTPSAIHPGRSGTAAR